MADVRYLRGVRASDASRGSATLATVRAWIDASSCAEQVSAMYPALSLSVTTCQGPAGLLGLRPARHGRPEPAAAGGPVPRWRRWR